MFRLIYIGINREKERKEKFLDEGDEGDAEVEEEEEDSAVAEDAVDGETSTPVTTEIRGRS